MQASITQILDTQGNTTSVPYHHNGQVRVLDGPAVLGETILKPEELEDIHLQNAATSLRWNPPSYGLIDAYTARIEPVARGGVHGRGLWLSGTNEVRWELPEQPRDVRDTDWYLGVFVDDRAQPDEAHALLTFPDGSGIWLHGTDEVVYRRGDRRIHEAYIPDGVPSGWRHFGWRITDGGREVTLLLSLIHI